MLCEDKFNQIYGRDPEDIAFCPYRICPIGAHSDHNLGKITGLAINKGIHIAYSPKQNGVVEMASLQFPKRAQWHIASVPGQKQNDWADYLRGATLSLSRRYQLHVGLCGIIEGSLPIGGLSSSAAVIISFLKALCQVNGIHLTQQENIDITPIRTEILNYVSRVRPLLTDEAKSTFMKMWEDILALPAVESKIYKPGKQWGTNFHRDLVANILYYLRTRKIYKVVYKDNYNGAAMCEALEGDRDHSVKHALRDDPPVDVREAIDTLLNEKYS